MSARHHPDLVMCLKHPGKTVGRVCGRCDERCPICDSYTRPTTLVKICDECAFELSDTGDSVKCFVCGVKAESDAFYCAECTLMEKDVRFLGRIILNLLCKYKGI